MVIKMTNRLLAMVIAFAFASGVAAHAAQDPSRPLAPVALPAASAVPFALQTAASRITETATSAIDPSAAIRSAYQRDRVALEHLRQQASQLKGSAHPAFNQFVSDQEDALAELQRTALATTRPSASSSIAAMDRLVAAAQAELNRELAQPAASKSQGSQSPKSQESEN
jgi:hypothetical protein